MSKKINLKDTVSFKDNLDQKAGLWARTEVIGGYGEIHHNPFGKSTLDEVIFRTHNIVPIGGTSYVLEKLFGVKETQIDIPTMYDTNHIGRANSAVPTETYITPTGDKAIIYRMGHLVQLFGVGITGTSENDISIYEPDYREYDITMTKVNPDGLTITGTMLPFRFTQETLDSNERKQYFGRKETDGITGYYLKKFESEPIIKHIWKTGEDIDDEEIIDPNDIWNNAYGANAVESFIEISLQVNKKDIKEWFTYLEQEDRARINTIALFNGEYVKDASDPSDYGDYRDVRMFSKICINPEYLNLAKDLNLLYRIYTA